MFDKVLRPRYLCPFCFERIGLDQLHYRCANFPARCAPKPDRVLGSFTRKDTPPLLQRTFARPLVTGLAARMVAKMRGDQVRCPNCGVDTDLQLCPHCHNELHYAFGQTDEYIIAVIGAKETGKSHYIAVLIKRLEQLAASFNAVRASARNNCSRLRRIQVRLQGAARGA